MLGLPAAFWIDAWAGFLAGFWAWAPDEKPNEIVSSRITILRI